MQSGSGRSPYTVADTRREAETGTEVIRHRIAAVEIVRHCKIADILHHLFGSVCRRIVMIGVAVVCAVAEYRFLILLGSLGIGFDKVDMDRGVILESVTIFRAEASCVRTIGTRAVLPAVMGTRLL